MQYLVRRLELEGPAVVAVASSIGRYSELWRARNEAEQLARRNATSSFDKERECWQGVDLAGRKFRYTAVAALRGH